MSEPIQERLTVEQIQALPEFKTLTGKQQLFLETYCGGGLVDGHYDAVSAALTAYDVKSREVARIMSYSLLANIRIVAVLNRHFQRQPIEEFLTILDRAITNKKLTVAQVEALKLKCDIMGFKNRLPSRPSQIADIKKVLKKELKAKVAKKKAIAKKTPEVVAPSEYSNY